MAFFELMPEEKLPPDVRSLLDITRKRAGTDETRPSFLAMAGHPNLLRAYVELRELLNPVPSRFGGAPFIAGMLIAHRNGCATCFNLSRARLDKLGFDAPTLDAMCERPDQLSLPTRERRMVEFTVRLAQGGRANLGPEDYREMERAGFSKAELLEMVGIAAFWNLATTVGPAINAGLRDE
jgi:hypothetical protein